MATKSLERCIHDILAAIEFRKTVDYGVRSSVRKYNAAFDRILKNVEIIEKNYPEHRTIFVDMLSHKDAAVAFCCGCLILNHLSCNLEQKRQALTVIKELYYSDKLNRISAAGLYLVIQDWEDALQKETTN